MPSSMVVLAANSMIIVDASTSTGTICWKNMGPVGDPRRAPHLQLSTQLAGEVAAKWYRSS